MLTQQMALTHQPLTHQRAQQQQHLPGVEFAAALMVWTGALKFTKACPGGGNQAVRR